MEHTRDTGAGLACIACLRGDGATSDRSSSTGSDTGGSASGAATGAAAAFAPGGGEFGGAGAAAAWVAAGASGMRDDPYFFGTEADRAAYYDADDLRAFDAAAASAAAEAAGGDEPETDTGAS